jgi:hypothetical protein
MRRQEGSGRGVPGLRPARGRALRAVILVALFAPCAAGVTRADAAIPAPSYEAGPEVVSGGLLWSDFSLGQPNVLLSTTSGTRLLVQDTHLSAVVVDDGWMLVARPSGPEVGRVGGPLAPVRRLRNCPPVQIGERVPTSPTNTTSVGSREREPAVISDEPEDRLDTIANGDLYAVVRASCIDHGREHARLLVRVRLRSGALDVIGPVPTGAISLVASGSRVALTYESGVERRVRVEVLDARSARLLYRVSPPAGERGRFYKETQIDAKGDLLVTSSFATLPAFNSYGWWAATGTRVGHPLPTGGRVTATLAAGRIAYVAPGDDESEGIELLDLDTQATRTIATFSGSVGVEGLGLGGTTVSWAQQSYSYALKNDGEYLDEPRFCVSLTPSGPTELTDTPLAPPGPPITIKASPGPLPAGPPCVIAG